MLQRVNLSRSDADLLRRRFPASDNDSEGSPFNRTVKVSTRTIAFNKPYGMLPCFTDAEGRSTLADSVDLPDVYAAGRLDQDSEGLMILTSDGALANRITDPKHKLPKVYLAQVERVPTAAALDALRKGVVLSGKRTRPAVVRLLADAPQLPERPVPIRFRKNVPTAWIEITLHEGMNRQVRRMTASVGHPTLRLVRIAIGPIVLGDLQPGQWRELTGDEIAQIRRLHP
jgi:23S rRNA pseudouridine2457 synthase